MIDNLNLFQLVIASLLGAAVLTLMLGCSEFEIRNDIEKHCKRTTQTGFIGDIPLERFECDDN